MMHPADANRLYLLADFPQLQGFARQHSKATRLDGRACAWIYSEHRTEIDWDALTHEEKTLLVLLECFRDEAAS